MTPEQCGNSQSCGTVSMTWTLGGRGLASDGAQLGPALLDDGALPRVRERLEDLLRQRLRMGMQLVIWTLFWTGLLLQDTRHDSRCKHKRSTMKEIPLRG